MSFKSRRALDSSHARYPREANVTFCSLFSEESLQTWYSSRALLPLQAWSSWQIYSVPNITEIAGPANLTVQACSPWGTFVTPDSCESWESYNSRGAGHSRESWQTRDAGGSNVSLDSFDVAGPPRQSRDSRQPRDAWHSLDAFCAQVTFQSHRPNVSFVSFEVFHSRQDDGRWSWGPRVPSAAFKTWLTSQTLQTGYSEKSSLAFAPWKPGSPFESRHALETIHAR